MRNLRARWTLVIAASLIAPSGCGGDAGAGGGDPESGRPFEAAVSLQQALPGYCEVQGWRALVADGQVDLEDFPDSADATVVDGTPRLIDFTAEPTDGASTAERLDRMDAETEWGDADQPVPGSWGSTCTAVTTDADIVRTQGALGYEAPSGTNEPEPSSLDPALGADLGAYCQVQELRTLIAGGDLDDAWLPAEADTAEVDGTVRIIDFSQAPDTTLGHYEQLDVVLEALERAEADAAGERASPQARDALRECAASTTPEGVEQTQGAAGHAAG